MSRSLVLWSVAGFLLGVTAVLWLFGRQADQHGGIAETVTAPFAFGVSRNDELREAALTERSARYAAAARVGDAETLVSMIESTLRAPLSPTTTADLEALFERLFEVAPNEAIERVQSSDLPAAVLAAIFRSWAELDVQAAIALIGAIDDPPKERMLALAIVSAAGPDSVDDVVAASRTLDPEGFAMAELVQRAEVDPLAALRDVTRLSSRAAQTFAIAEIGRKAGHLVPAEGFAAAERIADFEQKSAYLAALYEQWSLTDLPEFLAHVRTLDLTQAVVEMRLSRAFAHAAEADAERLVKLGSEIGGTIGVAAEAHGLDALAAADPDTALAYVESVPSGQRRERLLAAVAAGYGRYDTDAALAWAERLSPPLRKAREAVMSALASESLVRAVELELRDPDTALGAIVDSASAVPAWFANPFIGVLDDPRGIADRILASDEKGYWADRMLSTTLSHWALQDPDGVIAWMYGHPGAVPIDVLASLAERMIGTADVERMIGLAELLPNARRPDWIGRALQDAARVDVQIALTIAERYRSEPFYDALLTDVVGTATIVQGPEAAARLLKESAPPLAVLRITQHWAMTAPAEAARWAVGLADEETRDLAANDVFETWAGKDPDAASAWVRSIADPALRQRLLANFCRHIPEAVGCG